MANLKNVIYLSNEDYETLVSTGTVTIDGTTLTYDENNVYITPEKLASTTEDGLMSAADKSKLDNVEVLPTKVNDKYLHTNSSTGALEWSTVSISDTKVTQTQSTDNNSYPLLLAGNTIATTTTQTTTAIKNYAKLYANPSTGTIYSEQIRLHGDAGGVIE